MDLLERFAEKYKLKIFMVGCVITPKRRVKRVLKRITKTNPKSNRFFLNI